ncbi:MAG: RNA-binding transcriptional accessory protein [Treponema sp.]|jgi:uncharacterized protein|nr:RNA-binding transcriptional accessory protein [Treponema sp.]
MELTQEFIDGLQVNEVSLMKRIAEALVINQGQVSAVISLLEEGSTVPFIARYRKEKTGSLDEVKIRDVDHLFSSGKNLETRRLEIIRGIFDQGKLTEPLYENIRQAASLAELEDIYAPYKRKKKTRGMLAGEKGLGPLAEAMAELETEPLRAKAAEFISENTEHPELSVATVEDALQGAMDIIAEKIAQDPENRKTVKSFYLMDGRIIVKASQKPGLGDEDAKKTSTYLMYWDYTERLAQIKPHRILAINRGEREKVLESTIDVDENTAVELLWKKYALPNEYYKTAIEDGLKRLLSPAVIREIRGDQSDAADDHGISVFSQNLKNLLMQRPLKGTRVLGIDPGIRTGTKCAFLDDTGKYLHNFVMYNHKVAEAKQLILEGVKQYDIQLIALGNGTGSREVQEILSQVIAENNLEVLYTVVDEDGASVYSASDIAREEFPDLDLTIRGAISIGRRLQDPLAELVKIDPKSIGVGLYQHDVNQKKLSETLDEVVSSVVNNVGVNLNTASASLLRYVSGINRSLAQKLVKYREEQGKIASRQELTAVPGMGPKSFEQCAGFLKIPESADPLDNTWVHPENYAIARTIRDTITTTGNLNAETARMLKEQHGVGDTTLKDIVEELQKPNRDPRDDYPKPVMQKGVVTFEDLHEGMMITGKIKNVVDFGAFVDLGIKETALVHISELSDHFVKDPMDVVKVGDVLEFQVISLDQDRRRIALSRKRQNAASGGPVKTSASTPARKAEAPSVGKRGKGEKKGEKEQPVLDPAAAAGRKRVLVVKKAVTPEGGAIGNALPAGSVRGGFSGSAHKPVPREPGNRYNPSREWTMVEDDGTMYNPFAEVLQKMREKKTTP